MFFSAKEGEGGKYRSVYVHRSSSHGTRIYGTYIKVAIRIAVPYGCLYQHQPPFGNQGVEERRDEKKKRMRRTNATQPLPPASRAHKQAAQHATKNEKAKPGRGLHCVSQSDHSSIPNGRPVRSGPVPPPSEIRSEPSQPCPCVRVVWLSPRGGSICVWPPVAFAEPQAVARQGRQAPTAPHAHQVTEIVRDGESRGRGSTGPIGRTPHHHTATCGLQPPGARLVPLLASFAVPVLLLPPACCVGASLSQNSPRAVGVAVANWAASVDPSAFSFSPGGWYTSRCCCHQLSACHTSLLAAPLAGAQPHSSTRSRAPLVQL
jgi:hypothetical protein